MPTEPSEIKASQQHATGWLECDRCGCRRVSVYFYLCHAAERKPGGRFGFYGDLSVRICTECVREMRDVLMREAVSE